MSKFIVVDGLDGSGKATQCELLRDALAGNGRKVKLLSFPMYDREWCAPVRLYLDGALGDTPDATNAYAASTFFAVDRYFSYKTEWADCINDEKAIILANRYTSANIVHQLSKLDRSEWDAFIEWIWDFEFVKLGIPVPDVVVYLEMKPDISRKLIAGRSVATGQKMDIHETDKGFLDRSYDAAMYASDKLNWLRIKCYDSADMPLSREEIHRKVMDALSDKI